MHLLTDFRFIAKIPFFMDILFKFRIRVKVSEYHLNVLELPNFINDTKELLESMSDTSKIRSNDFNFL